MKKFFSFAVIAFFAMAATVLTSCNKDDDNNKTDETTYKYDYQAYISEDAFSLFNITVTRTAGSDVKTYSFDKTEDIAFEDYKFQRKYMEPDMFTSTSKKVSIVATVSLKSNWKEILAARGSDKILLHYRRTCFYSTLDNTIDRSRTSTSSADAITESVLTSFQTTLASGLSNTDDTY